MARLETQFYQIYLTHPESKKNSLILYEEQLTPSLSLYVVAELWNMQKKSESADLKKISEIVLQSFRTNKRLPAETLFETSLSTINQNLADLAHEGRKSWVGKFSCMICIKAADNSIYLANNGQTSAWLKRKSELMEILPAEKRGTHPLKTFVNFTQGKLVDGDTLILTTSNVFNYIAFELFTRILDHNPLSTATEEITKILKDSMSEDLAFCSFLLGFSRKTSEEPTVPADESEIYAPMPEEIFEDTEAPRRKFALKIPSLPRIRVPMPKLNFSWLKKVRLPNSFHGLSRAGKFFFVSFAIFLILFLINLGIYAGKANTRKAQTRAQELAKLVESDIAQTQSALIYKDDASALELLNKTIADLAELSKLSKARADELGIRVEQVKTVVNKINSVTDPALYTELKHHPLYVNSSSTGFLFANEDSNSLALYNKTLSEYFLLNSLKNPITSIAYFPPAGVIVSSGNQIFRIDSELKQFEAVISLAGDIEKMKVANGAIYALTNNQLYKVSFTKNKYVATVALPNLGEVRDFGVDKDIYVLAPNKLIKYVSGVAQVFQLPSMTDGLTNGDRILVASNIYLFESNKKRILVIHKNGSLINQIYFPTTSSPTDFTVDEGSRSIYVLDDNKLYKITF